MMLGIFCLLSCCFGGVFSLSKPAPGFLFNACPSIHSPYGTSRIRIIGGRNVTGNEMPWMVKLTLFYNGSTSLNCGGFVVDENWVMTAGHCLQMVTSVQISAGRIEYHQNQTDVENEQILTVPKDRIFIHPNFNRMTLVHDVGLIHLPQPLQFNENVQPICILDQNSCVQIPPSNSSEIDFCNDGRVKSAGWGADAPVGRGTKQLKTVNLTMLSRDQCQIEFYPRPIFSQQICAHGQGNDTCPGDSGGPLFCIQNGHPVAIGIVSGGPVICGAFPSFYSRICSDVEWVRNVTANNQEEGCKVPGRQIQMGNSVVNVATGVQLENSENVPVGTIVRMTCGRGYTERFPVRQSICIRKKYWLPPIGVCEPLESATTQRTTNENNFHCPNISSRSYENGHLIARNRSIGLCVNKLILNF